MSVMFLKQQMKYKKGRKEMNYYVITYNFANTGNNIYGVFASYENACAEFKRIITTKRADCVSGGYKIYEDNDTCFVSEYISYRIIPTTLMG